MNINGKCPDPVLIMSWLDEEYQPDHKFLQHVETCVLCQELITTFSRENQLLGILLDDAEPMQDLTGRVLDKALRPQRSENWLQISAIALTCLLISLALGIHLIWANLPSNVQFWPNGIIELLSDLVSVSFFSSNIGSFVLKKVTAGGEIFPAILITFLIAIVPMLQRRRYLI